MITGLLEQTLSRKGNIVKHEKNLLNTVKIWSMATRINEQLYQWLVISDARRARTQPFPIGGVKFINVRLYEYMGDGSKTKN